MLIISSVLNYVEAAKILSFCNSLISKVTVIIFNKQLCVNRFWVETVRLRPSSQQSGH